MKFVEEFRSKGLIREIADKIRVSVDRYRPYAFMEVCGTHTMAIARYGLADILPSNIRLVSGPGCPVCVTPVTYFDKAIELAKSRDVIITTFGDMFRVPGSRSSLERERSRGADIRIVYSCIDALECAKAHPQKEIVFLGIGFETTIPTVAASIEIAKREKIRNYSVLCGHKTMPEVLEALVKDKRLAIDGFLLPGHVSAIIGTAPYRFLCSKYKRRAVVAGFEGADIMQALLMLINQEIPAVDIQYTRVVDRRGNALAVAKIWKVFDKSDAVWRGIGPVKASGLKIAKEFASFDAENRFDISIPPADEKKACMCGDILKGLKRPTECKLYKRVCTPEHPIGACMVSSEGACAAYYRYADTGSGLVT